MGSVPQDGYQNNDNSQLIDEQLKRERLKFYRRLNREAELECLARALDEIDRKRWVILHSDHGGGGEDERGSIARTAQGDVVQRIRPL